MAKFCVKCGKPLVEGQPCSCEQEGVNQGEMFNSTASSASQTGKEIADQTLNEAKNVLQRIKQMVISPVEEMGIMVRNKDFKLSMEIIIAKAVIVAVFVLFSIMKLENDMYITFPKGKIFFGTLMLVFGVDMILAGSLFVVNNYIFKRQSDFKTVLAVITPKSVYEILIYIVGFIISLISPVIGTGIITMGTSQTMLFSYRAYETVEGLSSSKKLYSYIAANILSMLVVGIIFAIFKDTLLEEITNMVTSMVSSMLY